MTLDTREDDHFPLAAQFVITSRQGSNLTRRRTLGYDRNKLTDQSCSESFLSALANVPSVPIYVDNTSHCHVSDTILHELLCEHFPLDETPKIQEYVTNDTLKHIVSSASWRRNMFRYRSRFDKACLRAVFGVFAGKHWYCKFHTVF